MADETKQPENKPALQEEEPKNPQGEFGGMQELGKPSTYPFPKNKGDAYYDFTRSVLTGQDVQTHLKTQLLNRYAQQKEVQGDFDKISERMEEMGILSFTDAARGVGNGVNNFAVGNYNLLGHSLFGLPSAQQAGWKIDAFGQQTTVGGHAVSGLTQGLAGFFEARTAHGKGKKLLKKMAGQKNLSTEELRKEYEKRAKEQLARSPDGMKARAGRKWIAQALRGVYYGALGDYLAFDPSQGNLGNGLLAYAESNDWETTNHGMWEFAKEWSKGASSIYGNALAVDDPLTWREKDKAFLEESKERLKGLPEGMILGATMDSLLRVWRYFEIRKSITNAVDDYGSAVGTRTRLQELFERNTKENNFEEAGNVNAQLEDALKREELSKLNLERQLARSSDHGVTVKSEDIQRVREFGRIEDVIRNNGYTVQFEVRSGLKGVLEEDVRVVGDAKVTKLKDVYILREFPENSSGMLWAFNSTLGEGGKGLPVINKSLAEANWGAGLQFEKGSAPLDDISKSSHAVAENEIYRAIGIDPDQLLSYFKSTGEGEGFNSYMHFLKVRAMKVQELSKGIDMTTVNSFDRRTRHILTKATYDTLQEMMEKTHKSSSFKYISSLKDSNVHTMSRVGSRKLETAVLQKMFFENDAEGLKDLELILKDLDSGNTSGLAMRVGNLFNPDTDFFRDTESLEMIAALADFFPAKFKSKNKTVQLEVLLDGLGINSKEFAEKFDIKNWEQLQKDQVSGALAKELPTQIKEMSKTLGMDPADLWDSIRGKSSGAFAELKNAHDISWEKLQDMVETPHGLENLPKDSEQAMMRILAYRIGSAVQVKSLTKQTEQLTKRLAEDIPLTSLEKLQWCESVSRIIQDREALRGVASNAGRTLRMFQDIRKMLKGVGEQGRSGKKDIVEAVDQLFLDLGGEAKIEDVYETLTNMGKDPNIGVKQFETTMKEVDALQNATGYSGLLGGLNEVWMNSILSAPKTHMVNQVSNTIKAVVQPAGRIISSYLPDVFWKNVKKVDPVTGKEMETAAFKAAMRRTAVRQAMYSASMGWDIIRLFIRGTDEYGQPPLSPLRQRQVDKANEIIDRASLAAENPAHTLGTTAQEFAARNPASFDNLSKNVEVGTENAFGPRAGERVKEFFEHPKVEGFGKLWDGFMKHIVRQPSRRLLQADQVWKQLHFSSSVKGQLFAYAQSNMDKLGLETIDDIKHWVADNEPHMYLPNGNPITKAELSQYFNKQIKDQNPEISQHAQALYVRQAMDQFQKKSPHLNLQVREQIAKAAFEDAEYLVFQRGFETGRQDAYHRSLEQWQIRKDAMDDWDSFKGDDQWKLSEDGQVLSEIGKDGQPTGRTKKKPEAVGNPPKEPNQSWGGRINDAANDNPALRMFFPFVRTPTMILRDAGDTLGLGFGSYDYKADILSGSPMEASRAMARRVIGLGIYSGIAGLYGTAVRGTFTGKAKRDKKERATQAGSGFNPYSFNIGSHSISFDRLEPYGIPLKIFASMAELERMVEQGQISKATGEKLQSEASAAIASTVAALDDASYLKGLAQLTAIVRDLYEEKDIDQKYGTVTHLTDHLTQLVPSLGQSLNESIDSKQRITYSRWDKAWKRAFPYGLPAARDPLFGRELDKKDSGPLWLNQISPLKINKNGALHLAFSELASMGDTIGPPSMAFEGYNTIPMADMRASVLDSDPSLEKAQIKRAKHYKLPKELGGAACPIHEGQSFYDFYQHYISVRKQRFKLEDMFPGLDNYDQFNPRKGGALALISPKDKNATPQGRSMTDEQWKSYVVFSKRLTEEFKDKSFTGQPLFQRLATKGLYSLDEIILGVMTSEAYREFYDKNKGADAQSSPATTLIRSIITKWRNDSLAEIKGKSYAWEPPRRGKKVQGITFGNAPVILYDGIAMDFWPNMMLHYSLLENHKSYQDYKKQGRSEPRETLLPGKFNLGGEPSIPREEGRGEGALGSPLMEMLEEQKK